MKQAHRRITMALAMAPFLAVSPALAQSPPVVQSCTTTACQSQQQSDLGALLSPFASFGPGSNVLTANFDTIASIYLTATEAQRIQAAWNADINNVLSRILEPPNNHSPLGPSALNTLRNNPVIGTNVTNLFNAIGNGALVDYLKDNFQSYASYGWSGPYNQPTMTSDPRPFQTNPAVWGNPWTNVHCPQGMSPCPVQVQQDSWTYNGSDYSVQDSPSFPSGHSIQGNIAGLMYAQMIPEAYQELMWASQQFGLSRNIIGVHYPLDVIGGRITAYYVMAQTLAQNPNYVTGEFVTAMQINASQLRAAMPIPPVVPYAPCAANVAACIANNAFPSAAQLTANNQTYVNWATYGLPPTGPTNLPPVVPQNAELLIATRFPYLTTDQQIEVLASTELPSGGPLDDGSGWARLNLYAAAGGYGAFNADVTVTMDATQGGFSAIDLWSNNIGGPGGLTKLGTGTLVLGGNNTYTGGTTVGGGTLALSGTMIGDLSILPGATFVTGGGYSVSPTSTLSNAGTFESVNATLVNQGTLASSGTMLSSLANSGTASNTGTLTGDVVNSGAFANNGVVNGAFANLGVLSGTGTLVGTVTNAGSVAPGNSIGTLSVVGNYSQTASGTYQAEFNTAGNQSDLVNVTGAATLGGTVSVTALPSTTLMAPTTYQILSATGGISGAFAVSDPYPFLQTGLSYDPNNVFLNVQVGFAQAAATQTQQAVGAVLDANLGSASGDFATVMASMAYNTLSPSLAQATLTSLSGNNYAGLSSSMVQGAMLFMNNFTGQIGGGQTGGARVAIAEACDVACDPTAPATWGAWGGGLGGLGTIGASQPVGGVTYNVGGFAAGLDRQVSPTIRLGVTAGYTTGTQWVSGFSGKSTSDTVQAGLYGNFVQDKVYADAIVGYAYSANQMWRQISVPGLQPRTALGQTGANQWYGQIETGYRFDIGTAANAFVTPFARLQAYTGTQNGFTETGAQSLNLSVAQQTTNSLRTVLGAQLGGAMDLGWREKLAVQFRLGWSHEYADTARPVTASFAGAPTSPFTTFGVAPTRDGVVLGLAANTAVADATSVYLRYEGDISGQDSAHAITAGLRMTW